VRGGADKGGTELMSRIGQGGAGEILIGKAFVEEASPGVLSASKRVGLLLAED